jgi:hypothetical protein
MRQIGNLVNYEVERQRQTNYTQDGSLFFPRNKKDLPWEGFKNNARQLEKHKERGGRDRRKVEKRGRVFVCLCVFTT